MKGTIHDVQVRLCGCCEGIKKLTPQTTANRPGLEALSYRVGTHATFLETMKARLSNLCLGDKEMCQEGKGLYPLQSLTTRDANDPAIAMLDAWATVADVLTFYQERIANEGYLLTATERRSILELARLVGYRLRPGVAASAFLAFTLEEGYEVKIPAGTRAQSLPCPGELPQPFETSEPLLARDVWNAIKPRLSQLQLMEEATHTVYLKGINTNLKPNDPLLDISISKDEDFSEDEDFAGKDVLQTYFRRVHEIEPESADDRTKVFLRGDVDLTGLEELILKGAPSEDLPEDTEQGIKNVAQNIPNFIWNALHSLLSRLRDPDLSADALKKYIQAEMPYLEQAGRVFGTENGFGFTELSLWVSDIKSELEKILKQLDLRRAVLGLPGRLYPNQFIDPKIVPEIIEHLKGPEDPSKKLIEEALLVEPDTATPVEILLVEPKAVTPVDVCENELNKVKEDTRDLLKILVDDTVEEDDKILAIVAQDVIYHRLYQLWRIFVELESTLNGNWVLDLHYLLMRAITDVPSTPNLPKLISPLLKSPSRPPASALRLERTVDEVFEAGADIAPRMLTTLQRQLRDTLYQAWAKTESTLLSPLQGVEALRVKAAPFGAKAPLKPIYNDEGVIIGHEEWLLLGISVHLSFEEHALVGDPESHYYYPPVQARIVLARGTETLQEEVMLDDKKTSAELALHEIKVSITASMTPDSNKKSVINEILIDVLDKETIRLECALNSSDALELTIGDYSRTFSTDETRVDTINGGQVMIISDPGYDWYYDHARPFFFIDDLPIPLPSEQRKVLTLDAEYNQIMPGSWVVIEWPEGERPVLEEDENPDRLIRRVEKAETVSKANYGKVTQLTLDKEWLREDDRSLSVLRGAVVYAQSESLELAEEPMEFSVQGNIIRLDGLYGGLEPGRWLIVSGERADIPGTCGLEVSELVMLSGVRHTVQQVEIGGELTDLRGDRIHTTLQLADELAYSYKRDTVTIYGNVVKATHGETRREVLGSGDGNQARQSFTLKQSPLTYLAAATPSGVQSTLEARVNDVRWHEADNMIWLEANDRGYITRTDNEDKTTIIFGDGRHGARLPTGIENVRAVYRTGIGKAGNVAAEQISLLATRPLGVKSVINPLRASGGADREKRDQARRNAPLVVMALDRLVSLQDYADFCRTYAGIDKASAVRLSDGRRELIHLTIAGVDDIPIDESSDLYQGLCQALHRFGPPHQPVRVAERELVLLLISARLRLLPDYEWESVIPQVRTVLLETFSFDRRDLGQDVLFSKVLSVMQGVPGVAYVDVDVLDGVTEDTPLEELEKLAAVLAPEERIVAKMARIQTRHVVEREIETLSSIARRYGMSEIDLWEMNEITDPDNLEVGKALSIPRRIRPAQLAYLSPDVPDTLILTEWS